MSTLSVDVQIPADVEAPIVADFTEHALRVAFVERAHILSLPMTEWDVPGIYVLMAVDGSNRVYVGQARSLRSRLAQHNRLPKLPWKRVVAVKRDTTAGFHTSEIGYLEGRVAAELNAANNLDLIEGQSSGDETLPKHVRISLDAFVKSILGALRLAGLDIRRSNPKSQVVDEPEPAITQGGRPSYNVTVSDLVSSGLIQAGTELYLKQAHTEASGNVTADGEIIVKGVAYKSPSSAAARALGLQSSNGWITWKVGSQSGPQLDSLRQEWLAQKDEENGAE